MLFAGAFLVFSLLFVCFAWYVFFYIQWFQNFEFNVFFGVDGGGGGGGGSGGSDGGGSDERGANGRWGNEMALGPFPASFYTCILLQHASGKNGLCQASYKGWVPLCEAVLGGGSGISRE